MADDSKDLSVLESEFNSKLSLSSPLLLIPEHIIFEVLFSIRIQQYTKFVHYELNLKNFNHLFSLVDYLKKQSDPDKPPNHEYVKTMKSIIEYVSGLIYSKFKLKGLTSPDVIIKISTADTPHHSMYDDHILIDEKTQTFYKASNFEICFGIRIVDLLKFESEYDMFLFENYDGVCYSYDLSQYRLHIIRQDLEDCCKEVMRNNVMQQNLESLTIIIVHLLILSCKSHFNK